MDFVHAELERWVLAFVVLTHEADQIGFDAANDLARLSRRELCHVVSYTVDEPVVAASASQICDGYANSVMIWQSLREWKFIRPDLRQPRDPKPTTEYHVVDARPPASRQQGIRLTSRDA
jgi:hypothetical protein